MGMMAGEDRSLVLWALSSLMVAEERITTRFAGSSPPTAARRPPSSPPNMRPSSQARAGE
jgi:hypothetical protein